MPIDSVQEEMAPPITIVGKIFNTKGEPLSGANVMIKGTFSGVSANKDGEFTLRVPDETVVLVISFQGLPVNRGPRTQ